MEEDGRPAKIRKLSPGQPLGDQSRTTSTLEPTFNAATSCENQAQDLENHSSGTGSVDVSDAGTRDENNDQLPDLERKRVPQIDYSDPAYAGMSKNQVKKLIKKQEWEAKREDRKVIRKEKLLAKRERRRMRRAEEDSAAAAEPSSTANTSSTTNGPQKQKQSKSSVTLPITIVIDCNFDELMRDNERLSLAAQITRAYSDNKAAPYRAHLTISSFSGKLRERFEGPLAGMYKKWRGVRFLEEDFVQTAEKAKEWMSIVDQKNVNKLESVFAFASADPKTVHEAKGGTAQPGPLDANLVSQGEIVYLSSESSETLTELKPYSTYIIGGLVDKNREKGICHKRASEAGVRTARLPIGDFMDMQSRKVLATNHVNEILIKWLESGDWGDAFFRVIPKRKGGKLKTDGFSKNEADEEDEAEVGDEDCETRDGNGNAGSNNDQVNATPLT